MPRWQADVSLFIIALIWGSTFVMVKNALDAVGPLTFVGWRFIAASVLLAVLFRRRVRTITRAEVRAGIFIGLWLATGYILQTIGLQFTTSGKAGFITGLAVVLVPLIAAVLLRQPPGRWAVTGVVAATMGLALLSLAPAQTLLLAPGDVWVLGGAVGFALHIISVAHFAPAYDAVRLALVQIATVAVVSTGAAFLWEIPTVRLPADTWFAIIFTGAIATALVFSLQTHVQRFTTPTHTALFFSLEPVFAALFGWWWAGEVLGQKELLGCGLILVGMLVAELGPADAPAAQETESSATVT